MRPLPEHDWSKADGWVVRNLMRYGNSMVPRDAVDSLIDLFEANWIRQTEEILTRILRAKGRIDNSRRVWLVHGDTWQAKWLE